MACHYIAHLISVSIYHTDKKSEMVVQSSFFQLPIDVLQHGIRTQLERLFITEKPFLAHHATYNMFKPDSDKSGGSSMPRNIRKIKCEIAFFNQRIVNKIAT